MKCDLFLQNMVRFFLDALLACCFPLSIESNIIERGEGCREGSLSFSSLFSGDISDVLIPKKSNGRSKGFAFVTFLHPQHAASVSDLSVLFAFTHLFDSFFVPLLFAGSSSVAILHVQWS